MEVFKNCLDHRFGPVTILGAEQPPGRQRMNNRAKRTSRPDLDRKAAHAATPPVSQPPHPIGRA
jgi:hypothetical protein